MLGCLLKREGLCGVFVESGSKQEVSRERHLSNGLWLEQNRFWILWLELLIEMLKAARDLVAPYRLD